MLIRDIRSRTPLSTFRMSHSRNRRRPSRSPRPHRSRSVSRHRDHSHRRRPTRSPRPHRFRTISRHRDHSHRHRCRRHKSPESSRSNSTTSKDEMHDRSNCIFCRICDGKEKNSILLEDEQFVVFRDHRPMAKFHLLVVTKEHIDTVENLSPGECDTELLNRMVKIGKSAIENEVLLKSKVSHERRFGPVTHKILSGFHLPPHITVHHLHLHVLYPSDKLSRVGKNIFKPDGCQFVEPEWVQKNILKSSTSSNSQNYTIRD